MATIIARNQGTPEFGGTPYGNVLRRHVKLQTSAAGVPLASMVGVLAASAAIQVNDKIVLGALRAGMRLDDAQAIVSDAFTAATTGDLGFEYADGIDSSDVPQDPTYFFAALALSATGRTRSTGIKAPVTLPKDARLILTAKGAVHASVGRIDILVDGEDRGPL